jgi:hypothetical protein
MMDKNRELFHRLANRMNNISLVAGLAREEMNDNPLTEGKRKERDSSVADALQKIEDVISLMAKELEELQNLLKDRQDSQA